MPEAPESSPPSGAAVLWLRRAGLVVLFLLGFVAWARGTVGFGLGDPVGVAVVLALSGGAAMTISYRAAWWAAGIAWARVPLWVHSAMVVTLVFVGSAIDVAELSLGSITLLALGFTSLGLAFANAVAEAVRAQQEVSQRALLDERRRMAGEVHDVVGHTLAVTMLHLGAARLSMRSDPEAAARALDEAERHGRASLQDLRGVVRLLRTEEEPVLVQPGLGEVAVLVESYRSGGLDVRAELSGLDAEVSAVAGLATYRIVQEGLTNAVKHGRHSVVEVAVTVEDQAVSVRLVNELTGRVSARAGLGVGLPGMRERAQSSGGTFEAGPSLRRGRQVWLLDARIPW